MTKIEIKNQGTNHLDEILTWCEDKMTSLEKATDKPLLLPIHGALLDMRKQIQQPQAKKPTSRRRATQAA